jgi:O-antigen/teichoic acid export membrane protein
MGESIWMLQLLTFAGMLYPIHALNLSILNVKGRSDLFLRLEIIKKTMVTIVLVASIPFGLKVMIFGQVINSFVALLINTYYTKQEINYGFLEQMGDLIMVFLLSLAMGLLIYFSINLVQPNWLKLLFGFTEGLVFYLGIAWLFNIGDIKYLPSLLKMR